MKYSKFNEKGTLLVEALAMLGLIAMVTPTLYKKSAERMQEIQDINMATQVRTMNVAMDSFIKHKKSDLLSAFSEDQTSSNTVRICKNDSSGGNCFQWGYSSFLPYGYNPDDLRYFGDPMVYVHRESSFITALVIYPRGQDLGDKRSARLASLVGANGGIVKKTLTDNKWEIQGTGGAWGLDDGQLSALGVENENLLVNSLAITSDDPISVTYDDNNKFLYRIRPEEDDASAYWQNTMTTDLYMGGHNDDGSESNGADSHMYSIFNVRKMTMNTNCNYDALRGGNANVTCDPNVADLYIGQPIYKTYSSAPYFNGDDKVKGNTGAAWIYGNLSALSNAFKLEHSDYSTNVGGQEFYARKGYDILRFGQGYDNSAFIDDDSRMEVIYADTASGSARIGFMNSFVQVREIGEMNGAETSSEVFLVGRGDGSINPYGQDGYLIAASGSQVRINDSDPSEATTYINAYGGTVYINKGSSGAGSSETYINTDSERGKLLMGYQGQWLTASGSNNSARVHILSGSSEGGIEGLFVVGVADSSNMGNAIYADESSKILGLRGGAIQLYGNMVYDDASTTGGVNGLASWANGTTSSLTAITSKDVDIFGRTYIGIDEMDSSDIDRYSREGYRFGVAGSAWVDRLLWARQFWTNDAGFRDLHAGLSSATDWKTNSSRAWFNVYYGDGDGSNGHIVIKNRGVAEGEIDGDGGADNLFFVNSSVTYLSDGKGALARFKEGQVIIGAGSSEIDDSRVANYFMAGDTIDLNNERRYSTITTSAQMVGDHLAQIYTADSDGVVSIQNDAIKVAGRSNSSFSNENGVDFNANLIRMYTTSSAVSHAQFEADSSEIRTKYVDFGVYTKEDIGGSSNARFLVRPDLDDATNDYAQVNVNGTFNVHGNDVIRISHKNISAEDDERAMLEVDPQGIRVISKGTASEEGEEASADMVLVRINPKDTSGEAFANNTNQSIYIRKGAIELESSVVSSGNGFRANEGFGYIKANRFVSNAIKDIPVSDGSVEYDQYMVNPAYTSVMHDIKLTTRGGARLSDILPDYILKGVYNVSNDYDEEGGKVAVGGDQKWASPKVGKIPFPQCPAGYDPLATIMPVSFAMAQAGSLQFRDNQWVVDQAAPVHGDTQQQIASAAKLGESGSNKIKYMEFFKIEDEMAQAVNTTWNAEGTAPSSVITQNFIKDKGWVLGVPAILGGTDENTMYSAQNSVEPDGNVWKYKANSSDSDTNAQILAMPLYFQQNTWLKTSVQPVTASGYWEGRIGFIYDTSAWNLSTNASKIKSTEGITSNQNDGKGNGESTGGSLGNYVWNLFPVPTNTLEGQATVYCYFNRANFKNYTDANLVDSAPDFSLEEFQSTTKNVRAKDPGYKTRLEDPTLVYNEPDDFVPGNSETPAAGGE